MGAILVGPKNDKGFSEAAYDGVVAAEKADPAYKLTAVLENRESEGQQTDAIQTLAPINNVVLGVTATLGAVVDNLADQFPSSYFMLVDAFTAHYHKNVTGFANDWGSPSYVAGVLAGKMTKSNVIGFVGGAEFPTTEQSEHGFAAGAESVNPQVKVLHDDTGNFNDVAAAKAATSAMIAQGADVIMPYLDAGTVGAYQAGKESGKDPAMFKITSPECGAYDNIVGTVFVNNEGAAALMLEQYAKGTLKAGTVFVDLQEPKLQTFTLCSKYEKDAEAAKTTKETIEGINSGSIKLPADALYPRPDSPYQEGFSGPVKNATKTG